MLASMRLRQVIIGILAFPLSALPFLAYGTLTPEGRLIRDKVLVAVSRPVLPALQMAQRRAAARVAPRYDGAVMALVYHGLGSSSDGEGGTVISPKRFGEHLATLKAAGMNAVTAADVARSFTTGRPLPPNAVMITFDDGRTDAMMFADPLLDQAGMKATMFVITGAASKPGVYYASWDRLEDASRSGRWDLQAHTDASHVEHDVGDGRTLPALTSLKPGESIEAYRTRVRRDLGMSSAAIAKHTGRRPVAFAYPFGAYGADRTNSPAIRQIVQEEVSRRYALAFHQDEQETVPLATPDQDRAGIRRLEVGNWSGVQLLRHIAAAAARTPSLAVAPTPGSEEVGSRIGTPLPPDGQQPAESAPAPAPPGTTTTTVRVPVPGVPSVSVPPLVPNPGSIPPVPTTPPTTIRPPAPPPTVLPTTTTTVPGKPDNCGGKAHGNPCKNGSR